MLLLLISILVIFYVYAYYIYQQSDYKDKSGYTFFQMIRNRGINGEYRSYYRIDRLPIDKRVLTNVYIPTEGGNHTEIDLIMICTKGFYVLEVKNYRGWIYGNENQKMWTQTFRRGRKSQFYNPIWQNRGHIKALQEYLKIGDKSFFKSWIIMGRDCTLKTKVVADDTYMIYEQGIANRIAQEINMSKDVLTKEQVNYYFEVLQACSRASESTKRGHINRLQRIK